MKFTALLLPLTLASTTLASSKTISSALATVDAATTKLGTAVTSWRGDLLGTLPIIAESTALLIEVKKGTKTAKDSAPLDLPATLDVATATNKLVASVNTTLGALISSKKKFDKLLLSPIIYGNLGLQKYATEEMSKAIIAKVPSGLQDLAKGLVAPISKSFELALDTFHP
ncbi:putative antigenic cell wall protein [Staphylotrichum tortipilum]|uniref:Antigenic cell wall protein n=1 Tax=Staphylotrichum tortipilum TaxID=2831512 RepID=A0AAN6MDQ7_9PEZI|nr:putative antigenic cell wall protein [Staphylotrichum longicolle]